MTSPAPQQSTAVWYFTGGTFTLATTVFLLTLTDIGLGAAVLPLVMGAGLLVLGGVVLAREIKQRRRRD